MATTLAPLPPLSTTPAAADAAAAAPEAPAATATTTAAQRPSVAAPADDEIPIDARRHFVTRYANGCASWVAWRHVLTANTCWQPALPSGMIRPAPLGGKVLCQVVRRRGMLSGGTSYELYLQAPNEPVKLLLAARKVASRGTLYKISLDPNDFTSADKVIARVRYGSPRVPIGRYMVRCCQLSFLTAVFREWELRQLKRERHVVHGDRQWPPTREDAQHEWQHYEHEPVPLAVVDSRGGARFASVRHFQHVRNGRVAAAGARPPRAGRRTLRTAHVRDARVSSSASLTHHTLMSSFIVADRNRTCSGSKARVA